MLTLLHTLVYLVVKLFNIPLQLRQPQLFISKLSLLHSHGHSCLLWLLFRLTKQSIVISIECTISFIFRILRHLEIIIITIIWILLISHVVTSIEARRFNLLLSAIKLFFLFFIGVFGISSVSFILRRLLVFFNMCLYVNRSFNLGNPSCRNVLTRTYNLFLFDRPLGSFHFLLFTLNRRSSVFYFPGNLLTFFCIIKFVAVCLSLTDLIFDVVCVCDWRSNQLLTIQYGIFTLNLS